MGSYREQFAPHQAVLAQSATAQQSGLRWGMGNAQFGLAECCSLR